MLGFDWIGTGYLIAFFIGIVFSAVTVFLGGLLEFGHGGIDAAVGGSFDVSHDFAGGEGHGGGFGSDPGHSLGVSPYSPMMVALFLTCFGGIGYLLHKLAHASIQVSLPISAVSGFVIAFGIFSGFAHLARSIQASSEPARVRLHGVQAEVITPIPAGGVGQIAYIASGARFNAPAQSEDGAAVAANEIVRIVRYIGGTAIVRTETKAERAAKPAKSPDKGDKL